MLFSLLCVVFFRVQTRHLLPIPILMITHIHSHIYLASMQSTFMIQPTHKQQKTSASGTGNIYTTRTLLTYIFSISTSIPTALTKWLLQEALRIIIQPTM